MVNESTNELFKALAYLHSLNYAHLDISPFNILFSSSGCLQVCDFGLSMHFSEAPYPYRGTTNFIAPEMYKNQGQSWYPDIWSASKVITTWMNQVFSWKILEKGEKLTEDDIMLSNLQKLIENCSNNEDKMRPSAIQILEYCNQIIQ